MGNNSSRDLTKEFHKLEKRLSIDEKQRIQKKFHELAARCEHGDRIDPNVFKSYFDVNDSYLQQRMFDCFDVNNSGFINEKEFFCHAAIFSSKVGERVRFQFLFSLFDAEGSASLSKEQFRQMFDHIPTHVIHMCPRTSRDEIVYHAFEECECNQMAK